MKHEAGPHRVQRAGHRVARPHPHIVGHRDRVAGGRRGRRRDRRARPADRRVPLVWARWSVRQHDRLGGAHHAQADRARRVDARREESDPEQGEGAAGAAVADAQTRARPARSRGVRNPAAGRRAAVVARRRSGPTTSRRTGSPTTACPVSRSTSSTACWRVISTRSPTRSCTTSRPAGSPTRVTDRPTWRQLVDDATARLGDRLDARRIAEQASGYEGAELTVALDVRATALTSHTHFRTMLERRAAGEPLQYVLGRWGFRTLDVFVDDRVLIPRPETEIVVEHALGVIDRVGARVAVDLGTGSGVIALSLAVERPGLEVWGTDASAGRARRRAREPRRHRSSVDASPPRGGRLVRRAALRSRGPSTSSSPTRPMCVEDDPLPAEVSEWEPRQALVAGPTGLEAIERILGAAPKWLGPSGQSY